MHTNSLGQRKMQLTLGLAAAVALIAGPGAMAAPLAVPNFSFETPAIADGTSTDNSVPGWSYSPQAAGAVASNAFGVLDPGTVDLVLPTDGDQVAYLDRSKISGLSEGPILISPVLAVSTAAGQSFTLTADVGASSPLQELGLVLLRNGQFIGGNYFFGGTSVLTTHSQSISSTAAGQTITILLFSGQQNGIAYFDNVLLDGPADTATPEPATLAAIGAAAVIFRRRRR